MTSKRSQRPWEDEPDDRVRVLVECQHTDSPGIIATVVEREGYAVRTCEGPDIGRCELVEHGHCGLVEGADVVVNLLRDPEEGPKIADAVASLRRPPALVVERSRTRATPGTDVSHGGPTVVHPPITKASLVAAIDEALQDRPTP
ncbi:MAG: hypothetical protein R2746_04175 [Acidimicrobiales bacterium]